MQLFCSGIGRRICRGSRGEGDGERCPRWLTMCKNWERHASLYNGRRFRGAVLTRHRRPGVWWCLNFWKCFCAKDGEVTAGSDCWQFLGGAQVNEWAFFASRGGSPAPKAQALLLGRDDAVNLRTRPTHPVSVDSGEGEDFGTAANSEISQWCSGVRPFLLHCPSLRLCRAV